MEGEVVVLEAVIISTPPPHEILWYHNGNGPLVDSNQRKIVQEGEDVFKLILLGVSGGNGSSGNGNNPVRHDGHYQIKATNIAGSVQSTCQVFVQSKPVQVISLSIFLVHQKYLKKAGTSKLFVGVSPNNECAIDIRLSNMPHLDKVKVF